MRKLTWAALAVIVAAGCTPRDNRDSDLELEHTEPERVYAEPTVTGGAYDSIIYRSPGEVPAAADAHAPSVTERITELDGADAEPELPDAEPADTPTVAAPH